MSSKKYYRVALVLSALGLLFAGYMSAVKLVSNTCAFNEPCPYFLGYPACWYGFAMYALMFAVSLFAVLKGTLSMRAAYVNLVVSGVGIIFAGSYALPEIAGIMSGGGIRYTLGLPTCVYGLIFYLAIFILTLVALIKQNNDIYNPQQ